ncbi:MAG: hypothetical protein UY98_C0044G0005 [Candidatus Kaiserbacteria bacterium GW2011_GWA2_58_9]|uniref:Uncharacterized protein n=1 Tax=Candidatus Kaiserbacteria bacterium GW2011_GWA2_58_9 TaxID=1618672 RepID=A0A0G2AVK0_9BACT|nr:MAG: hypothetical protein UY98_C0044G0005 [Candidatus Kaiserbacteria bacterium GW2011_GWA2_58_9]
MKNRKQFIVHSLQKMRRVLLPAVNCQLSTVNSQKGFTLLLAALVSSIVLALGTSIFQLAQKELTLSSIGRDSQFAFYAADSGAECALYWDVRYQRFPTSTPASVGLVHADGFSTNCGAVESSPRALQRSVELRY